MAHRSIDRGTAAPSIWLRPQRGSRGPASQWTREDVAAAGVSLADAGGLEAVTMRSIAARLGTAGASLYRIVDSRAQVLELMADHAIGEFDYAGTPPGSGGVGLMRLAVQARVIYARHPWLLASATADPVLGPNAITYLDHALGTLADTRLTRRQRLEAVGIVAGLVRVLALDETQPGPGRLSPAWQDALSSYLRDGTNPNTHPHLSQALHSSEPEADSTGDRFEAVVGLVIAALLRTDQ